MNLPPTSTYEQQLAARAAELLPGIGLEELLELLGAMDPDDMRMSLAWLISHAPHMFDFALVRDRAMIERLEARLDEEYAAADEPYCETCGASIGVFHGRGDAWLHYTGVGTAASPVELFDAGHEPVIAWRPARRHQAGTCWCGDMHLSGDAAAVMDEL
jgi:hypothetical protein